MVDREGKSIADVPLELPESQGSSLPKVQWLDGDRWIVARSVYEEEANKVQAWFFDVAAGKLTGIEGIEIGSVERISRIPIREKAGFVILGRLHGNYTIRDQLQPLRP